MFKLMLIRNKLTQVVINKPNKIKYPSYSFKNKPKKHRAIIKPLDQPEKEEEKEQLFIKPKMGKEDSKFLKQINEKHIKEYYSNVKEFIMDFDSNNNNMLLWYIFHTVPLVITITYSPLLLWVHQVFWVSTSMGLVFCSYEMYSSKKEKEILDDHMNKSFLVCNIAIGTGIINTMTTLEPIGMLIYLMNYIGIYYLMTKNNKQFFIPKWFSQSFKRYLITMMLFTIVGLLFSSQTNKKFDMTSDIEIFKAYHKYLKQMTRICEEVDSDAPNLNFIRKQILDNK